MPEGPEVWILSKAINTFFKEENTLSYGKHLFISDKEENWSFGLTGKVFITESDELIKMNTGWIYGDENKYENINKEIEKLGIDFMMASEEAIRKEVDSWIKSKKKLAGLLLDQTKISGIGVAWGSEILYKANLRPDMRTCDQNLSTLSDSILYIREKIKNIYEKELKANNDSLKDFVNEWFSNLYEIREMEIYKKGSGLSVLGRTWWV
jgi:formamidopyrimidine-DNA glycosylase